MAVLDYREFCKKIRSGDAGGVFIFFGAEDYTKYDAVDRLKKLGAESGFPEFNVIKISPDDFSSDALAGAVETPPLMSDRKVVVVYGSNLFDPKLKNADLAIQTLKHVDSEVMSVAVVFSSGEYGEAEILKHPICKELGDGVCCVKCDVESPSQIHKWIGHRMSALGVSASEEVTVLLAKRCLYSMFSLVGEIKKLASYALSKGRTEITKDDVLKVVTETLEVGAFELTNALSSRRISDALAIYAKMKARNDLPKLILGSVVSNFACLYMMKSSLDNGISYQAAAKKFGVNEYRAKLMYNDLVKTDAAYIRRALEAFSAADRKSKSLDTDKYAQIEQLICSLR